MSDRDDEEVPSEAESDSDDSSSNDSDSENDSGQEEKAGGSAKRQKLRNSTVALGGAPSDISFGVYADILAVSTYASTIDIIDTISREVKCSLKLSEGDSEDSLLVARTLEFTRDENNHIIAGLNDKSVVLYDVNSDINEIRRFQYESSEPAYCLTVIDENTFAVGNDDGQVFVWDVRMKKGAKKYDVSKETVNSVLAESGNLFCALDEGRLATIKIRAGKVELSEAEYENPFVACGTFRDNTKLAVADDAGFIYIFDWNKFSYHSDVFKPHKSPISDMVPITEKIGIFGFDDGTIRAINFFPHVQLGIIGKMEEMIHAMDISRDGRTLASVAHSNTVAFWDVGYVENMAVKPEKPAKQKKRDSEKNLPSSNHQNKADFFSAL